MASLRSPHTFLPSAHRPSADRPSTGAEPLSSGECRTWLARHHEGRIDYCTGRGPRSLVVRYTVLADAVLVRVPTYNDLLQYAPGESVTLEVEELSEPDLFQAVTVTGTASLLDPPVPVLAEDWPPELPTDVISVPIQQIDGFVAHGL